MSLEQSPLILQSTLDRMEPDLSVPSVEQSLASLAISLKRLADSLDKLHIQMQSDASELRWRLDSITAAVGRLK